MIPHFWVQCFPTDTFQKTTGFGLEIIHSNPGCQSFPNDIFSHCFHSQSHVFFFSRALTLRSYTLTLHYPLLLFHSSAAARGWWYARTVVPGVLILLWPVVCELRQRAITLFRAAGGLYVTLGVELQMHSLHYLAPFFGQLAMLRPSHTLLTLLMEEGMASAAHDFRVQMAVRACFLILFAAHAAANMQVV